MTQQLQTVLQAASAPSLREKLELLQAISRDLQQAYAFTEDTAAFWKPKSLEDLATAQSAPVVTNVRALAVDFWPDDESADDINQFIAERRHADRLRGA